MSRTLRVCPQLILSLVRKADSARIPADLRKHVPQYGLGLEARLVGVRMFARKRGFSSGSFRGLLCRPWGLFCFFSTKSQQRRRNTVEERY